jgi:hypothetical protein
MSNVSFDQDGIVFNFLNSSIVLFGAKSLDFFQNAKWSFIDSTDH